VQAPSGVTMPSQTKNVESATLSGDHRSPSHVAQLKLKLPELPDDGPLPAVVLNVEKIFAVLVLPHCGHAICAAPWGRSVNRSNVAPHASQRYSKMGIRLFLLLRVVRQRRCLAHSRRLFIIGEHTRVSLIDEAIQPRNAVKTYSKKIVYLQMWFIASAILSAVTTGCCTASASIATYSPLEGSYAAHPGHS
jgi:hypothetical protein